jgi:hypothetical protein
METTGNFDPRFEPFQVAPEEPDHATSDLGTLLARSDRLLVAIRAHAESHSDRNRTARDLALLRAIDHVAFACDRLFPKPGDSNQSVVAAKVRRLHRAIESWARARWVFDTLPPEQATPECSRAIDELLYSIAGIVAA